MFKGLFFFIKQGWKYDKRYIMWNILSQLVNAPLPFFSAVLPKLIIDELTTQKRIMFLIIYVTVFTGYVLTARIFSSYFQRDGFTRRCQVAAEFDNDLHRQLYECDFENLESCHFLEMQEKAKKFLYCNWHGFGYLLDCTLNIGGYIIGLAGVIAIIAMLDVWIVILFVLFSLLGAYIDKIIKKKVKKMEDTLIFDQRGWSYYSSLFEKAEYGKEFRIYQVGEWLLNKEREFFTRANSTLKKQNKYFMISDHFNALFTFVQQAVAYGYLIYCVITKDMSLGSFTMYISAITAFAANFRQITSSLVEIRTYDMYYEDLDKYLSIPKTIKKTGSKKIKTKDHVIEFKNVSFRYPGSRLYALQDINIRINPKEKLLLVGENGAGKSTFIKLLLRLYDPTDGEILLDGVNIKTIDYDNYMKLFSAVFQDFHLYSFSIKENVAMSNRASDEKIDRILRKVGLGDKIYGLNNGINTSLHKNLDDQGFEPSGGEAQRIAIARALCKDAPIIVLDEPTAALDPRAEFEIYEQFNDLVNCKTAIYISHRLSSAKFCDKIAVFENGYITEYGDHDCLINNNGKYSELFNMQAEFYT